MATTIFRIRIEQKAVAMSAEGTRVATIDALAFRLAAASQQEAEHIAAGIWSAWMHEHPGIASSMRLDWPNARQLGETRFDPSDTWD
jgi:hypothetical protein